MLSTAEQSTDAALPCSRHSGSGSTALVPDSARVMRQNGTCGKASEGV